MKNDPQNTATFRAATLAAVLARHYPDATPHAIALAVDAMQRATRIAKRFAEDQCNYDLGDPDDSRSAYARRSKRQDSAEKRINGALQHAGLIERCTQTAHAAPAHVELGGDPRGACGHLIVPGMPGDGWGDGFAIY